MVRVPHFTLSKTTGAATGTPVDATTTASHISTSMTTTKSALIKHVLQLSTGCDRCEIVVDGGVRIFYWPVTLAGSLCLSSASTITPSPTGSGPNTAVIEGMTFTPPSVYISVATMGGMGCGRNHTNELVPVRPEAVSSIQSRGYTDMWNMTTFQRGDLHKFNFADLNRHGEGNSSFPLVPFEAYLFCGCTNPGIHKYDTPQGNRA